MTFSLTWLPEVLDRAGLLVAEVPGWRTRGRGEMGRVRGVMCHHTATSVPGNMPTLHLLVDGRSDLSGPLSQLGLGRDGTFYVVAAGRANHAGAGNWEGIATGNSSFIGIEAENSGDGKEPWPEAQMDAYRHGVAAILDHIGAPARMCCGHQEYAGPRKSDPSFDMSVFRKSVADLLAAKTPKPPIPARDAKARPTLRRGARGDAVAALQRLIRIDPDGVFGARTEAALRASQREAGLVPDGIAGPETWAALADGTRKAAPEAPPADTPPGREIGAAGLALVKQFEGCEELQSDGRFKAYPDPGSKDGLPWTIGWGATGGDVTKDSVWTQEECDARLVEDMKTYAAAVRRAIGDAPTTQNQFDAMVSFHYNTGRIRTATLTKRHIARDYEGAREAFGWWVKNDGHVMRGLVRRRKAEADLYATPDA